VEKGTPGYNATVMTGKASLRAVWQAEINFDDMRVPAENRLPVLQQHFELILAAGLVDHVVAGVVE
jgi:alkylation response protein AidB-like acyl-CoA dehydrogenase